MGAFSDWMREQAQEKAVIKARADREGLLPEGLWLSGDRVMAQCRGCERSYEIGCDPSDFHRDTAYCGGSPHCIP